MATELDESLYLTNEQYVAILLKIKAKVFEDNFKLYCYDSVTPGNRFTESNCGFCNEGFTDKETALFPKQFPERAVMKYRRKSHKCPFDMRGKPGILGWGSGCFYECLLFKAERHRLGAIRIVVEGAIKKGGENYGSRKD